MEKLKSILNILNFLTPEDISEILNLLSNYSIDNQDKLIIKLNLQNGLKLSTLTKIKTFNNKSNKFSLLPIVDLVNLDKTITNLYISEFLKSSKVKNLSKTWAVTSFDVLDNKLIIKYHNDFQLDDWKQVEEHLLNYLENELYVNIKEINFAYDEEFNSYQKKVIHEEPEAINGFNEVLNQRTNEKRQELDKYPAYFSDVVTPIGELNINDKNKVIQGKIFNLRMIKLRNGFNVKSYYLTDEQNSFLVKEFTKSDEFDVKINDQVKMIIDVETSVNDSKNFLSGKLKKYEILPQIKIEPEKDLEKHRIEFNVHSKMSAYDGLINLDELKTKLSNLNHEYFAITDRYNVQNYPDIYKTFKDTNIKPIYGVELEVLPKVIPAVVNPLDINLDDAEYVVFDLETTGLYPVFNDIIEFGAVTIKNNQVIDKTQFFIKPNTPLSEKVSELTNITQKDLEGAIDQKTGLIKIIDYIKGKVLVAHNGINFDFNFLNTKLAEYNFEPLNNCLIDTMVVSRGLNTDYKSHTLEVLAKKLKITYDSFSAHRADYDAMLLKNVWVEFIELLKERECNNISEINNLIQSDKLRQSTYGDFVVVYAKNQIGIKNIYELVSISHTKGFFGRPTITWEEINPFRDNLLITNLCIESDVLTGSLSYSDLKLTDLIKKYDFISICGPSGFHHEISTNLITSKNYELALQRIINICSNQSILLISVSNTYYLEKPDKQFHDLYVMMPTLNKKPHRFFKYKTGPIAFFKNTHEMIEEFSFLNNEKLIEDIVINNPNQLVKKIDFSLSPVKHELYPPKINGVNEKVKSTVYSNAHKLYGDNLPKIVEERINKELDSIIGHGYAVVYWISHLLVKESITDGYVVGSRGSVGSSLVATLLEITDVNPLPPHYLCKKCRYSNFDVQGVEDGYDLPPITCPDCKELMYGDGHNILFEVFLGFYGDKVPDIDLNFSGVYQNKAHNFIKKMFGEDHTFRAGTISTIAEKTSFANTRNYFQTINKEMVPSEIERFTAKCVDVKRTTGQHPGGIIVVPDDMSIYDFTPYNYPADDKTQDWYTTHFAFEHIHDNLLKFDILGHDNPTILRILKDLTGIDEKDIPHYDLDTMSLFSSLAKLKISVKEMLNEPTGVLSIPEFGTKFVREMLVDTKPSTFADLIRISGLSHGTDVWLGNAKDLIKGGLNLSQIIACRDDIMNYLIASGIESKIAFNIMEDVRKGKGIKPDNLVVLNDNKIPEWYINSCNKIKYMFPKAHATAYVMHAWKFAWYKLNYPLEYYASYFSIRPTAFNVKVICKGIEAIKNHYLEIDQKIKQKKEVTTKEKDLLPIYEVAIEMHLRGYKFEMVDINKSAANEFLINRENASLICPFVVLDGLGDTVASSIIDARNSHEFENIEDLVSRTKVSKQHLEVFSQLGITDHLEEFNQIKLFDI